MKNNNFLDLQIDFSQQNHCSVFFAHLQNTIKRIDQPLKQSLEVNKICYILYDIFKQHEKLQQAYDQVRKSMKQMMTQFASMINQCKQDREKLMQATKDRYDMLQKLKQCNQDAIQISNENQMLKQTIGKMKELNQLLVQKNNVTQEQLANRVVTQIGTQSFQRISKEYDRLLESNTIIRKQLSKITDQSQNLNKISKTMQIISKAFQKNPKIKDQIWDLAKVSDQKTEQGSKSTKQTQLLKKQYYQFNFDQFLKQLKNQLNG